MGGVKFMQVLDDDIYNLLAKIGRQYGISVQELLRAQTVPDWLEANQATENLIQLPQIRRLLLKQEAKFRVKHRIRAAAGRKKRSRSRYISSH